MNEPATIQCSCCGKVRIHYTYSMMLQNKVDVVHVSLNMIRLMVFYEDMLRKIKITEVKAEINR